MADYDTLDLVPLTSDEDAAPLWDAVDKFDTGTDEGV